jgi:hypothetical protein
VNSPVHDFRTRLLPDSRNSRPPKFVTPPVRGSRLSHVHDSETSPIQDSRKSHVCEPEASQVQDSRKSPVRDPEASLLPRFLKIVNFLPLKTYLKNFVKLDVSRVTGFPKFPNAPRWLVLWRFTLPATSAHRISSPLLSNRRIPREILRPELSGRGSRQHAACSLLGQTRIMPMRCYGQHKLFPTSIKMILMKCMYNTIAHCTGKLIST